METITVTFHDTDDGSYEDREIEIPISVKGSMWAWLTSKPVANRNPYRTLLEHCCTEGMSIFGYEECTMFVSTANTPKEFDKRLIEPNPWVCEDETLSDTHIIIKDIAGEQKKARTEPKKRIPQVSGFKEYMEAMRKK